ncbi:MAG: nucleotide sugar dehydrogenase [Gammaproteobacteria bacterium]|nr:nucleotide sugar dehydrogenase [Gammaproteobacteria bacterium]MDH3467609.1 nucleotide sugar dehydrogenase [Gammaproteobacteria bacterium]
MKKSLLHRLEEREAIIGILGLGYVGFPLLSRFAAVGYRTIGFDVDSAKIDALNVQRSYLPHIDMTGVHAAIQAGTCEVTIAIERVAEVDAVILCVPTPLDRYREPDLSFVTDSVEAIAPHMHAGQVLSLESTTYPGTTEEELRPRLERAGFVVGESVFLVYSPEREDPANPDFTTRTIPKVVSGSTSHCLDVAEALYSQVVDTLVPVSSTQTAELTKILENIYRAVNIALVNELKMVAEPMGIDIFEVVRAAATKPFGFNAFYPGPGLGGHCIPIDPFYLTWKAREYGVGTKFIELAGEVNTDMPAYVVEKITDALNRHVKPVRDANILVLGIAYKKNVGDVRESPSIAIISQLLDKGARVSYSDPHVHHFPRMRKHYFDLHSEALTPDLLAGQDCVVVATDHEAIDWDLVRKHARLIVDTRGVYEVDNETVFRA